MFWHALVWFILIAPPTSTNGVGFQLTFNDLSSTPKPSVTLAVEAIPDKTYCQFTSAGFPEINLVLDRAAGKVTLLPGPSESVAYQYEEEGLPFLLNMGIKQLRIDEEFTLLQSLQGGTVETVSQQSNQIIEGYECQQVAIRSSKGLLQAWVAPELIGKSSLLLAQWQGLPYLEDLAALWMQLDKYGFPLSISYASADQNTKGRIVLSALTFSIPASTFDLSGYTIEGG